MTPDFDPDKLNWLYPNMQNTLIHPDVLKYINRICWRLLNKPKRIDAVTSMYLAGAEQPSAEALCGAPKP